MHANARQRQEPPKQITRNRAVTQKLAGGVSGGLL